MNFFIKEGKKRSITLIELLIVMGILAILGGGTILMINPAEILKESRDIKRISDIKNLEINLLKAKYSSRNLSMGAANTVYVSLPDSSPTCSNLKLPELPLGWSYSCVSEENLLKTDGSGWIPIDFDKLSSSVGNSLPVDPINSDLSESYYVYSVDSNNNFYISANNLESDKYTLGGEKDKTSTDGGKNDYSYEEKDDGFEGDISGNIVVNTNLNHLSDSYNPGWDTNLNGSYQPTRGFSTGYLSSVPNPSIGYHGHFSPNCGIGNSGCIEFIDKNTQFGYPHRLQEIYQTWQIPGVTYGWKAQTIVRVKFMAKTDNPNKLAKFGLLHWSNSQNAYVFDTALASKVVPKKKEWNKITQEFSLTSDWELNNHDVSLYLYGNDGEEGTLWIDNVQVEYLNP